MATTTRSRLRALLATATGFYYGGTNTGTATNTVVDTGLQRWDTGRLIDRWVLMTAGNNDGESRRISAVSTSTATVGTAFSGSNANGNTFDVLPFDPNIMHYALEEAMRTVWPKPSRLGRAPRGLYLPLIDESLVVDNLLSNFSFETNTTGPVAFTDWASVGTPTLQVQSGTRVHGTQSVRIDATGATEGLSQNILPSVDIGDAAGKTLSIRGWLWALTADIARMRVTFDNGSTYTNGPYHQGGGDWEGPSIQKIDVTIPASTTTAQTMIVSIEVANSGTSLARVDAVMAWVDPIAEYPMPTTMYPDNLLRVLQQVYEDRPEGPYAPIRVGGGRSGRVLRLEGINRISVPTTDAGTTEVDEIEAELIVAEAAVHMFRVVGNTERENRAEYLQESERWERRALELRESVGHSFPGADAPTGWRVTPEKYTGTSSAARFLYLER
jgi:hypothetical protein